MSNRWKLRPDFFTKAGSFTFSCLHGEKTLAVQIDRRGYFELPGTVPAWLPLGVYAKAAPASVWTRLKAWKIGLGI
jgi:hypothetical protein